MSEHTPRFPDDTDWEYKKHELEPVPIEIDIITGKKTWEVNGCRLTADTYVEALRLLPLIEDVNKDLD
jgi:hypothetical protein